MSGEVTTRFQSLVDASLDREDDERELQRTFNICPDSECTEKLDVIISNQKKIFCCTVFGCICLIIGFMINFIILYEVMIPYLQNIERDSQSGENILLEIKRIIDSFIMNINKTEIISSLQN